MRTSFPFSVFEVIAVYKSKQGEPGIWFELADGRVYDKYGEPDTTDPDDYAPSRITAYGGNLCRMNGRKSAAAGEGHF
jgi:hypothetical protein